MNHQETRQNYRMGKNEVQTKEIQKCIVIVKGKLESRYCFRIQGTDIPTIKDSAIKCLGKWYDETLKDSENVKRFKQQVSSGLVKIERHLFPGKY